MKTITINYIKAIFEPRYWEDTILNGKKDKEGLISIRRKDSNICELHIDIKTGEVLNWKKGDTAKIHYKVCDAGEYFIIHERTRPSFGKKDVVMEYKYKGDYVPNILCVGDDGYGDYIILNINSDGFIDGWNELILNMPPLTIDKWPSHRFCEWEEIEPIYLKPEKE